MCTSMLNVHSNRLEPNDCVLFKEYIIFDLISQNVSLKVGPSCIYNGSYKPKLIKFKAFQGPKVFQGSKNVIESDKKSI